jgi:hypothetical protein
VSPEGSAAAAAAHRRRAARHRRGRQRAFGRAQRGGGRGAATCGSREPVASRHAGRSRGCRHRRPLPHSSRGRSSLCPAAR